MGILFGKKMLEKKFPAVAVNVGSEGRQRRSVENVNRGAAEVGVVAGGRRRWSSMVVFVMKVV